MAVTINGTTGVAVPLGTAAAPGVVNTTSATTGIYNPTSTTLGLSTNGTNAVYIDASQNVGIGLTAPAYNLHVRNGAGNAYVATQYGTGTIGYMLAASNEVQFKAFNGTSDVMTFATGASERLRIDSSGNLLAGTTTPLISGAGCASFVGASTNRAWFNLGRTTSATNGVAASITGFNGSSQVCSIDFNANGATNSGLIQTYTWSAGSAVQGPYVTTGGTSWTTPSDENLKDIIEPIENGVEKLSSLRSIIGKFKTDQDDVRRIFLIAQDVQKVLPEAICTDPNGYLGINYQDLIPVLVAAIQELSAEVEALKAKVGA